MSHLLQGSRDATALSMVTNCSGGDSSNEAKASSFEFQFHTGIVAASRPMVHLVIFNYVVATVIE